MRVLRRLISTSLYPRSTECCGDDVIIPHNGDRRSAHAEERRANDKLLVFDVKTSQLSTGCARLTVWTLMTAQLSTRLERELLLLQISVHSVGSHFLSYVSQAVCAKGRYISLPLGPSGPKWRYVRYKYKNVVEMGIES